MKYRGIIIDLDGVVWRGRKPIKRNIEAIKLLHSKGLKTIYLSNNATRSRKEYVELLREHGLAADLRTVINSAYAAVEYVREHDGYKVFIVGEAGLYYEASIAGLLPVTIGTPADHVITGMDRFSTYYKLTYACRLIKNGAVFVAANTDRTYPVEDGEDPGAGTIVSFIETYSGRKPDIVTGKPNPWILDLALKLNDLKREEVLIIGDRLDTDVMLGLNTGVDTLLVLTGVARVEDIEKTGINPTYVAKDLLDFISEYPDLFGL